MIRIARTRPQPAVLERKGRRKATAHKRVFTRYAADYRAGLRTFSFDSSIYGDEEVKTRLRTMQHGKCAFCDSYVDHISYGDVEHFRPKGGSRQNETATLQTPGYYWLAYDWDNLLFSCQLCNQRHKANLFPLVDASSRARTPADDLRREAALFIDPTKEDPEQLIGFDGAGVPFPINNDPRADATIRGLGLNRPELNIRRAERLSEWISLRNLILASPDHPDSLEAKQILRRRMADSAEYAAMARRFFPEYR